MMRSVLFLVAVFASCLVRAAMVSLDLASPDTTALESLQVGDTLCLSPYGEDRVFALKLTGQDRIGSVTCFQASVDGMICAAVYGDAQGWYIDVDDWQQGLAYRFRQVDGASWEMTRNDTTREPVSYDDVEIEPVIEDVVSSRSALPALTTSAVSSDIAYIDMLFAFDANAKAYIENTQKQTLETYAAAQISKMNGVITNSKLNDRMQFRLVGTVSVAASTSDLNTALDSAAYRRSGWEAIAAARDRYGADIVSVVIDTGSESGIIGSGYGLSSVKASQVAAFDGRAYHAISVRAVYAGHYVEIHETGHNLGAGHSDLQDSTPQSTSYSFGYYFKSYFTTFFTIMAYAQHPQSGTICTQCPMFSSPDLTYWGAAAGDATHDNRRVLSETCAVASRWRNSDLDTGPVATFKGFGSLTSGGYTLDIGGNSVSGGKIAIGEDALRISGGKAWGATTNGMSVLVKYSSFGVPSADRALISFKNTIEGTAYENGVGVFAKSGDGTVHGVWQGSTWTGSDGDSSKVQVCNKTPPAAGYLVLSYTTDGTVVYDAAGNVIYQATALKTAKTPQFIGDVIAVGGLSGDTMVFGGLVIEGIRIYKGALTATEVPTAVADFEEYDEEAETYDSESVSINFIGAKNQNAGRQIDAELTAGAFAVPGAKWNQIIDAGGTQINEQGIVLKELGRKGKLAANGMTVDVRAKCCWTADGVSSPVSGNGQLMYGYLDDGETDGSGYGATITINNIPYSEYTLYVYMGTDMGSDQSLSRFGTVSVNGVRCPALAYEWSGRYYWGTPASTHESGSSALTLAADGNYFVKEELTGSTLTIKGAKPNAEWGDRCGIAGIQIVNTGGTVSKPIITKNATDHTWIVDTSYGSYAFSSDDKSELKSTAWKVTLRSSSALGATIGFGTVSSKQASHYIIESGSHSMTWLNGENPNIDFDTTGTADNPSILVKDGATLNLTAKDITGWLGAAKDKMGNLIRVNEGGTLNLLQNGTSTHYYQGRYHLDPGATIKVAFSGNYFRLNGGATKGSEQLYVPDSASGSPVAVLSATGAIHLPKDETRGLGVYVGGNSRLQIDAALSSNDNGAPIAKWGGGTLSLNGSLTDFKGTLSVNEGTLRLARPTLGGPLSVSAGATLDIACADVPKVGATVLTAQGLSIAEDAQILVGGIAYPVEVVNNSIVIAAPPATPSVFHLAAIDP